MSQPEPTPPRRPGFLLSREGVSGLFLLLCAGLVGLEASGLAMGRGRMVGPGYFPMILAGLLAMFGATLLVQAWHWVGPGDERAHRQAVETALHDFEEFQFRDA